MSQAKILIVEDDPHTAKLLEYWLRAHHYQYIGTAASGQEALVMADSSHPDLVIMDIVLQGDMDGIDTADILLKRFDIPVLYLTAYTDESLFERARITSPAAYLTKPFDERDLNRAVEVALDRHKLLRQLKASEAHLAEAQAVAHIGSWRWDVLHDEVVASDEMLRLFNLTPGTFEPRLARFLQCIHVDDRPRVLQAIDSLQRGIDPGEVEVRIDLDEAQPRILRLRGSAHFDGGGKANELLGTALDVSKEWEARQQAEHYRTHLESEIASRTADLQASNQRLQAEIAGHLETEANLEQSESRYRSLVEILPDAVFVTQEDRVTYVNPAAVRLAKVQNDSELLGKSVADLVQGDTLQRFMERKQAALVQGKHNPPIAYWVTQSDGSRIEVESVSFGFQYAGRPAFLVVMHDLTERRKTEHAAARFRIALDSSPDAIFLIDPVAMRFIDANVTACTSLGYTLDELMARGPHDIKPDFNRTSLSDRFQQVLAGMPGTSIIQTVHLRKDGSTFPVEVSLRPFTSEGKQLMVVVARDVTDREFAEAQLKEANERFQQFADNVSEVFWIRDLDQDRFVYVSPAYETLFCKPVSTIYRHPRSFLGVVHPDDLDRVAAAFAWQRDHRQGIELEYRIVVNDHQTRWIWVRTFPIQDASGTVYRMAGIAEDVSKRRESEEQCRTIVQASMDGFLLLDRQGHIVDCNEAYCRTVGYSREELLDRSIADLDRGKSPDQAISQISRVMEKGRDRFDTQHIHKNGQLVDLEVSAHYQPDSKGGLVFGFVRDISERKEYEQALLESEANLERAQSIAHIGSWKLDLQTTELEWSDETYRIFGVPIGTPMTLERFFECVHPDDRKAVRIAWSTAVTGNPYDIEHRIVIGDTIRWVREQAEIRTDPAGQPVIGFGSVQDVTDAKQAELALRRSEALSRSILRAAPVGIGMLSNRVFLEVNDAMTAITGYRADELIGRSARMLYPSQAEFDYVGTEKYRQIHAHGIGSVETRWLRKDGAIINVSLSSSPLVAEDIDQGVTFTAIDITASKQAEQARLAHEASQRNALVREVHHRIKNNLQGVIGLLRQHISAHPGLQPVIETAIAQVNTVAVVHGLQSRIPQRDLRLRELLHEVSTAVASIDRVAPPTIEDTLEGEVWLNSGAVVTVALILNELLQNAFKHRLEDPKRGVEITLAGDSQLTRITIRNTGGPLPPNFDLVNGVGLGTGLDLVRTLLPRHGAQLNVYEANGLVHVGLVLSKPVVHGPVTSM